MDKEEACEKSFQEGILEGIQVAAKKMIRRYSKNHSIERVMKEVAETLELPQDEVRKLAEEVVPEQFYLSHSELLMKEAYEDGKIEGFCEIAPLLLEHNTPVPEIVTHFTPLLNLTPQEIEDILTKIAKEVEVEKNIYK